MPSSGGRRRAAPNVTTVFGLPDVIEACLFDLDGVLTNTASVHAAAWKETFDALLRNRSASVGEPFRTFDAVADYDAYVDGKPREDGVRDFLASRGISLEEGASDDPPTALSVHGVGNRKNELFLARLAERGVEAYPGSVQFVHAVRKRGLRRAVVSSSANCSAILTSAGIAELFEVRIDGLAAAERGLRGKPMPDTYRAAASDLGVAPARAAVFEDALAGVAAGRAGRFGYVVGVDRVGQAVALRAHGADRVVADLAELLHET